jgi:serine/threonine-protein kinase RsbW
MASDTCFCVRYHVIDFILEKVVSLLCSQQVQATAGRAESQKMDFESSMDTLTLPARMDSLATFLDFVLEKAEQAGASGALLQDIRLGLEEILVNVFSYAYPDGEGHVALSFSVQLGGRLRIRITDWGIQFNPLAFDAPDLTGEFPEREIGGMGVYLARTVAHQIVYRRDCNANHLTVFFLLGQD